MFLGSTALQEAGQQQQQAKGLAAFLKLDSEVRYGGSFLTREPKSTFISIDIIYGHL